TSSTGYITHSAPFTSPSSQALLSSLDENDSNVRVLPRGAFLLPTFVDTHLHAPQFLYQGTGLHLPLMQWLDKYAFRAEERIDGDKHLAKTVYEALARRLIRNGTGAVLLFGTIASDSNLILAEIMQRAGIRAFVGKLSMDIDIASRPTYIEASASAALAAAASFVSSCRALTAHLPEHARLVHPVLTPRFVPTCSDALLAGLGKLASADQEGLRIQSHLAEAADQVEWVRRTRGGVEDIDVFDRHGLLTSRTVQAHCTFLRAADLRRLRERGTAVAHCPLSNAYFSSEAFAMREALAEGVEVGLGTDVAGGYSVDVMSAMRWAVGVARMRAGGPPASGDADVGGEGQVLDWKGALYLATRGGAQALGLPRGAGTFDVGAPFDAQQIRLVEELTLSGVGALDFFDLEREPPEVVLTEEMVEKWWCAGDERNRVAMWVQGKEVGAEVFGR
ncbi:hypothetical protein H0H87_005352, partial [Tephrocybe sp. NHM501043]